MSYSSAAIDGFKTSIAHQAITRMFDDKGGWEGDAASGYHHHAMWPYPSLAGRTLPPVSGPTGVVQFFVPGTAMNAHGQWDRSDGASLDSDGFPPGTTIMREAEVEGMDGWVCQVDPWTDCYQPWLERIESALEGWETIPDHSRFAEEAAKAGAALEQLTPNGGFGDLGAAAWRPAFTDPARTNAFDLLAEYVGGAVESNLVYAFRDKYGPTAIRTVMANQGQVALGLNLVLGGEAELWRTAGDDVTALCEAASTAFEHQGGGGGVEIDLRVVRAFVDLVNVFVPPPAKVVVSAISAGLGFVQALVPQDQAETTPPPPLAGGTAEDVARNFEEALRLLRTACFRQEEELYRCASRLSESLATTDADFLHIHPGSGLDSGVTTAEQIDVHTGALQDIGSRKVPIIAAIFATAADATTGLAPASIWTRGGLLGYGAAGPQALVADAADAFDQVATGTARELVDAGARLAVAAGWIETTDEETRQLFEGLEDELARGQTGWSTPYPAPRPGPQGGR
ncbi:hypothetical protein GCM10023340_42250 [Nocardioides marinquilinus]|uniref:Uncharacterized protein n=1 Tax=Nocardioides marinquilinus TaxID=1210400 RepID=A0ABP9Q4S2_9ACTN